MSPDHKNLWTGRSPSFSESPKQRTYTDAPCVRSGAAAGFVPQLLGVSGMTKKVVYRSSESGEFVTKRYAESHPKTTERQHVNVPPPPKPGK